jgi:hypothetical protein
MPMGNVLGFSKHIVSSLLTLKLIGLETFDVDIS